MATKKQTIDTENNEELRTAPAAEESQDPASWVPPFTVRVYPLSNPKTKLLATASITIADSFAVKGFRIYDSKNGLFVKDPERCYVKNGTELTDSVFFPITKEARDILRSQILSSYELVMEQQERQHPQQKNESEELMEDDIPFDTAYTSLPIGGESSNAVIAGHRGYFRAAMFRDIEKLEVGDPVKITNLWETLTYRVVETKVILPEDIQEVLIQPGRDLVTLVTCHPYGDNTHRYVVYCEREE